MAWTGLVAQASNPTMVAYDQPMAWTGLVAGGVDQTRRQGQALVAGRDKGACPCSALALPLAHRVVPPVEEDPVLKVRLLPSNWSNKPTATQLVKQASC